ncbi:hypothetical protein BDB00DRAFT_865951 [Zychaea mexicana]|uniref:uncharacterized protein n=1 Tax=Zychaea mexicana TaxID=64656 RepID=UPI0022FE3766|nr:uncharacterized protein BDB00DRAFT_865951 [Zychaea mexicana]KAI9466400.1 hypothetical protein BDB00DRAFT_865951 [Zychaea mexicana]
MPSMPSMPSVSPCGRLLFCFVLRSDLIRSSFLFLSGGFELIVVGRSFLCACLSFGRVLGLLVKSVCLVLGFGGRLGHGALVCLAVAAFVRRWGAAQTSQWMVS